jgi:hypothetical protein
MRGEGGVAGSQPMSTAVHRSPNKLWRSNSILNPSCNSTKTLPYDVLFTVDKFIILKPVYRYTMQCVFFHVSQEDLMFRARTCKRLWSPGTDSEESISPAYVAWRAGTTNRSRTAPPCWESISGLLKRFTNTGSGWLILYCGSRPIISTNQHSEHT